MDLTSAKKYLTLEALRKWKGGKTDPPSSLFLALNFLARLITECFGTTAFCLLTNFLTLIR